MNPTGTETTTGVESTDSPPVGRGDRAAFDAAFARHAPVVLRYALRLTVRSQDAEELVQETFFTAWKKRKSLDLADDALLPWLLVTCRNHGANLQRKQARRRSVPFDEATDVAASREPGDELLWVRDEISRMSPVDQELCRLCLIEGVPYPEAAARLGLTTAGVAKRIERARKRLRLIRSEGQ